MLDSVIWSCVGAQVKDGSHVVIWTAYKGTHNQYETSCGFRPHPRECPYANGNISSLNIMPDYPYHFFNEAPHVTNLLLSEDKFHNVLLDGCINEEVGTD